MAYLDPFRSAADGSALSTRLVVALQRLLIAVTDWNDARVTRNVLGRLSDHELNDIGLSRGGIESLVRRL